MTIYKKLHLDVDTMIFITFHKNHVIAIGNVDDILSAIDEEVKNYMKENNLKMVNVITSNNFDVCNIEIED